MRRRGPGSKTDTKLIHRWQQKKQQDDDKRRRSPIGLIPPLSLCLSMTTARLLVLLLLVSAVAAAAAPVCPVSDTVFLDSLRSQCPSWIERVPPLEVFSSRPLEPYPSVVPAHLRLSVSVSGGKVSGDILDRHLARGQRNSYYAILFYASWCPHSRNVRPIFDALSSMFPQVNHLTVEESSVMPSVFSRYGIHSFPSILVTNQTTKVRYHGPKNLRSLVHFYKETTGLEPVAFLDGEQLSTSDKSRFLWPWDGSPREILANEPYLAFSLLFICLKAFMRFYPKIVSCIQAFLISYVWHLNLGIFGESGQLLERALHVIDLKKLWSKLRLCNKARNFQNGAKSARVWASSLASVSLGESSSRFAHSGS